MGMGGGHNSNRIQTDRWGWGQYIWDAIGVGIQNVLRCHLSSLKCMRHFVLLWFSRLVTY